LQTTRDLGAGYNCIVVNDDCRRANFGEKATMSQLCAGVMKVFLESEKTLKAKQGA
jgi:nicotinamidase-related amidase